MTKYIDNNKSETIPVSSVLIQSCLCGFMEMTRGPPLHCTSSSPVMTATDNFPQSLLLIMPVCLGYARHAGISFANQEPVPRPVLQYTPVLTLTHVVST